jgi:hypothetical protein
VFISACSESHFGLNGEALGRELLSGESALGRMEKEVNQGAIITFSEQIDSMLGSGVQLGTIAEHLLFIAYFQVDLPNSVVFPALERPS